jgi:hypothetical protein
MRQGQGAVARAERLPGQLKRVRDAGTPGRSGGAAASRQPAYAGQQSTADTIVEQWVVTPEVQPGQSMLLELFVSPSGTPRKGGRSYPFRVLSRPGDSGNGAALAEPGGYELGRISWFYRFLSHFQRGAVILTIGFTIALLIETIRMLL